MLLEYHEEWGVHHIEEVTKLLWVLSEIQFDEESDKIKMDFSPFLGVQ